MTTSEIPHHRHRYPQGDLPPLATPGKTTPQTARYNPIFEKTPIFQALSEQKTQESDPGQRNQMMLFDL